MAETGVEPARERRRLNRIETLLIERSVVTYEALEAAKDRQRGAKKPLVEVLLEQEAVDEDFLVEVLAEATGRTVVPEHELQPDPEVQDLVDADLAQRLGVLPLRVEGDTLFVATGDPLEVVAFDELAGRTHLKIEPLFAKPSAVRRAMREVREGEEALHDLLKNAPTDESVVVEKETHQEGGSGALELAEAAHDGPTVRLVNLIISDAITRDASDIHIEWEKTALRVRFRMDGELHEILTLPASAASSVISRIKIIAGLNIIETRRPQDGRAKVSHNKRQYDLRVSTLPSYFGEKAVIRVLDPNAATFKLDRAGLDPELLETWRELIRRPNGLLLLTGPTGSGKTSTLYASLLEIRDPKLNLVTVEDPVEYQFPGIVHVPVRSDIGMTFAAALRSILRQDPDVVLLGEIRDAETAKTAVQAAMTGHLVLSTLHTNDAFGAIPRLIDLGVDRAQLASCLGGVMAQRLARTNCSHCAAPVMCDADLLTQLDIEDGADGIKRGEGCRRCRGTGQQGRTAIAELIVMTPALGKLLQAEAPESELREQTIRDGTRPLVDAAKQKVLDGSCAPEEVLKVAAREVGAEDTSPSLGSSSASRTAAACGACDACGGDRFADWSFCPWCGGELANEETGPCVVICDDERIARRVASAALRKEFPAIREADSGEAALDIIAREKPDLLVVDMIMPGMSGMEVIQTLRKNLETASLPIIMLTASTDEMLETDSLMAGADDYLQKPVAPGRLRARARALLSARQRLAAAVT